MTRKRRRLVLIGLAMLGLGSATALALTAFQDNLLFFYSPTDLTAERPGSDRLFRLGGLVEENSVQRIGDGTTIAFTVTDMVHQVPVVYSGLLPDLFREGQGVVAQGRLRPDGTFEAVEVLAKHDENYMPPEVAKALRASGEWRDQGSAAPGAVQ